jgi:Mn2+/Fe2+ NRAMP family transporter
VLVPGAPLIGILYVSQALNAVLLLPLLVFIRRLASDPALMGANALRRGGRATTGVAVVALGVCVAALGVLTVAP